MGEAELRDYEQARRMHEALWADGDYTRVAELLTGVSAAVVEAAAIGPGMRVLDLGAGSGNIRQPADHGDLDGGHELAGFGAECGEAEDLVAVGGDEHLEEPAWLGQGPGSQDGGHRQGE